ncbi:MAG: Fic family protein [Candidatus Margulisiibacteriota bacterium]
MINKYDYDNRIPDCENTKKELSEFKPLSEELLIQIKQYYRIGLTYSSNALEGNTLTESETKVVLEDGVTIGGKSLREHQEALGHSDAFDFLYDIAKGKTINEQDVNQLHHLFYHRIDEANAGAYRKQNVVISGTTYTPPKYNEIPSQMEALYDSISGLQKMLHPIEFAAKLHLEFVRIHPYIDGNGRTARLLMNLAFMQNNYSITIIPPILRSKYIEFIRLAQTGDKDERHFINFISAMVYESQNDLIRLYKSVT